METVQISLRMSPTESLFTYTNWFELTLIRKPYIDSIYPVYSPAFESQLITVYGGNFYAGITVLFEDRLSLPLNLVSDSIATFETPMKYGPGIYSVTLFNTLHLNLITRP